MTITKKLGTSAVLKISTDNVDADYHAIELAKSANFNMTNPEVNVTDNDSSNQFEEFLVGNRTGSFSFVTHWDSNLSQSTNQEIPITEIAGNRDLLYWKYFPSGVTLNLRKYSFTGYIKEIVHNTANNTVVELTITVAITGAVTVGLVTGTD